MKTDWQVRYQGWSGFELTAPQESTSIWVDVPETLDLEDAPYCFFITHGHPEHYLGVRKYLQKPRQHACTVLASAPMCRFLARASRNPQDRFVRCKNGDTIPYPFLTFQIFQWTHMSLLPPGWGAALLHLKQILSHPRLALKILWQAVTGPKAGPMLGFRVVSGNGQAIVNFSEGLHRKCKVDFFQKIVRDGDILMFGIEPEDLSSIDPLLQCRRLTGCVPYEPHRPWRDHFGMPHVDLTALEKRLEQWGLAVVASHP